MPREYQVHHVPLVQLRARFEEAFDIIREAWSEEVFSHRGEFWSYKDVALWPRPFQRPRPPIWMPIVGSKEAIEFAAEHNLPITKSPPITCRSASARTSPTARPRRYAKWDPITSISISLCSATAISPRRSCSARSAMQAPPRPMFMEQIGRFAREVLPALQAHEVETVPLAEEVPA